MNARNIALALVVVIAIVLAALFMTREEEAAPPVRVYTPEEVSAAMEKASAPDKEATVPLTAEQRQALESASATEVSEFGDTKEEQDILRLLEAKP